MKQEPFKIADELAAHMAPSPSNPSGALPIVQPVSIDSNGHPFPDGQPLNLDAKGLPKSVPVTTKDKKNA